MTLRDGYRPLLRPIRTREGLRWHASVRTIRAGQIGGIISGLHTWPLPWDGAASIAVEVALRLTKEKENDR